MQSLIAHIKPLRSLGLAWCASAGLGSACAWNIELLSEPLETSSMCIFEERVTLGPTSLVPEMGDERVASGARKA